jgi:hypothetical protein
VVSLFNRLCTTTSFVEFGVALGRVFRQLRCVAASEVLFGCGYALGGIAFSEGTIDCSACLLLLLAQTGEGVVSFIVAARTNSISPYYSLFCTFAFHGEGGRRGGHFEGVSVCEEHFVFHFHFPSHLSKEKGANQIRVARFP